MGPPPKLSKTMILIEAYTTANQALESTQAEYEAFLRENVSIRNGSRRTKKYAVYAEKADEYFEAFGPLKEAVEKAVDDLEKAGYTWDSGVQEWVAPEVVEDTQMEFPF